MECDMFHDIKKTPLPTRESFNNTILLLTLVKSEHYYIVGFSRPASTIEIAFDFDSNLHSSITESMTVDFESDHENIVIKCTLANIESSCSPTPDISALYGSFISKGNNIVYQYKFKKDKVLPASIKNINQHLMIAKSEIIRYLENHYMLHLS